MRITIKEIHNYRETITYTAFWLFCDSGIKSAILESTKKAGMGKHNINFSFGRNEQMVKKSSAKWWNIILHTVQRTEGVILSDSAVTGYG